MQLRAENTNPAKAKSLECMYEDGVGTEFSHKAWAKTEMKNAFVIVRDGFPLGKFTNFLTVIA